MSTGVSRDKNTFAAYVHMLLKVEMRVLLGSMIAFATINIAAANEDCAWKGGAACKGYFQSAETQAKETEISDVQPASVVPPQSNAQRSAPHTNTTPTHAGTEGRVKYRSKIELLDAARRGELLAFGTGTTKGRSTSDDADVMNAFAAILEADYATAVPAWGDTSKFAGGNTALYCPLSDVRNMMQRVIALSTQMHIDATPPTDTGFRSAPIENYADSYRSRIDQTMTQLRNSCYRTNGGANVPDPFIASLAELRENYADATAEAVAKLRATRSSLSLASTASPGATVYLATGINPAEAVPALAPVAVTRLIAVQSAIATSSASHPGSPPATNTAQSRQIMLPELIFAGFVSLVLIGMVQG